MNSRVIIIIVVTVVILIILAAVIVPLSLLVKAPNTETTGDVSLIGNFAFLPKNVSTVSDSYICSYLTTILSSVQLSTTSCTILNRGSSGVNIRYKLVIRSVAGEDKQNVMKLASKEIAKASSDISTFTINQTAITFEDESGSIQRYCSVWSCSDANVVCISIIGGYECVCLAGYIGDATFGICSYGYAQRYCSPTGEWISGGQICDRYQDCPDDSDEINCMCDLQYQYACKNGRCIYKDWLCDGVADCPQGDDEKYPQCDECGKFEFRCEKPRVCISSDKQCDGQSDCLDSSDESRCVSFNGNGSMSRGNGTRLLTVTFKGTPGYQICSDNWNLTWSNRVCNLLGFGNATATSLLPVNDSFVNLNPVTSSSKLIGAFNTTTCRSQLAVAVSCQAAECGIRKASPDSLGPYIINGQRAARGAWPWQVVVYTGYFIGNQFTWLFLCGGILLNDRWILTAAHCTQITDYDYRIGYTGKTKPKNIKVILGSISLDDNPDMIEAYADQVETHQLYDEDQTNNDVGLIRLSQPVSFSETVSPICLPAPDQDLSRFRVCVDTGFGKTLRNYVSQDLLQAKMNIMPDSECSQYNSFYDNTTQMCIGTNPTAGDLNICSGDSGGPLSCQDSNGVWMVIGVNSYNIGANGNDLPALQSCRLSVVARVPAFVGWIESFV